MTRTETPRAGNSAQPHSANGSGELLHRTADGEDGRGWEEKPNRRGENVDMKKKIKVC